ncbi:MAG: endolytic transglycosylase MltG [Erysipelotrichaceae bacterium]|nr:endolytic transglycosylase MltG [Erysipelotrichaceae bacterium]
MKKKIKRKTNKVKVIVAAFLALMVIMASAVLVAFRLYLNGIKPVSNDPTPIAFTVEENSTVYDVIGDLYQQKLIQSETYGKIYVKLHNIDRLIAGNFQLSKSMSLAEIMNHLSDESNAVVDQVRVTIVDGDWAKDVAETLAEATDLNAEDILEKWNDINYISKLIDKYECLTDDILNSEYHVYLEGYLAPETYYFYKNTTIEQATEKLLDQTEAIYQKYKDKINQIIKENPAINSFHDLVTLASIVQYEGASTDDIYMIAGVLYNRLADGWKLQCSATVCYALYDRSSQKACETNEDINSPYNTYKVAGLPIGPICNPYEVALMAVIEPQQNDYYYFCADKYGNVYYARTLEEHIKNVNQYVSY